MVATSNTLRQRPLLTVVTANNVHARPVEKSRENTSDVALGLAITVVVPTIFWMIVAWTTAPLFGLELGAPMLLLAGTALATFLSIIGSALIIID